MHEAETCSPLSDGPAYDIDCYIFSDQERSIVRYFTNEKANSSSLAVLLTLAWLRSGVYGQVLLWCMVHADGCDYGVLEEYIVLHTD